jgi:hypothetical protein
MPYSLQRTLISFSPQRGKQTLSPFSPLRGEQTLSPFSPLRGEQTLSPFSPLRGEKVAEGRMRGERAEQTSLRGIICNF